MSLCAAHALQGPVSIMQIVDATTLLAARDGRIPICLWLFQVDNQASLAAAQIYYIGKAPV